ncbi:MAG: AraC family transcriptional regulator [Flavobacteriales bacterium]|jgi:AraC-like DNA-binding protein|nr:AraC family transcriptional regulator [Flavobacteriales bacterium]
MLQVFTLKKGASYSPKHKDLKYELLPYTLMVNSEQRKNDIAFFTIPSKSVIIIVLIPHQTIKALPNTYNKNEITDAINKNKVTIKKYSLYGKYRESIEQYLEWTKKHHSQTLSFRSYTYKLLDISFSFLNTIKNLDNTKNGIHDKLGLIHQIITSKFANPPSLNELSILVGLNIKTIKTEFKKEYGAPVFTYILNYKMNLAKDLLLEKEMNINEISSFLGYSTSSHFIFAFKKKFGSPPKQFLKQMN